MREEQKHSLTTPQRSGSTADERIDLALSRAYALLIRAADKARARQQQDQEQQANEAI